MAADGKGSRGHENSNEDTRLELGLDALTIGTFDARHCQCHRPSSTAININFNININISHVTTSQLPELKEGQYGVDERGHHCD